MTELRILLLEDNPVDAELNERVLRKAGIVFTSLRVETRDAFIKSLEEFRPGIILSDYKLPGFDGLSALQIVRREHPEIPVIMVTGALPDVEAVELIHTGAKDYVLKDRLARLGPAVQRVLSMEQGIRARKEAEAKFRMISESAQDAIIMMEPDGRITFWNAAAERIFGHTAFEAKGQELHALLAPPEQYAAFSHGYAHFLKSGEGPLLGKVLELTALRKGGEEFPVELSISAAQMNGSWHAIGIARDISERKNAEAILHEAEEKFRAIFESALDGIVLADVETKQFIIGNPAICRMLGYSPEEFVRLGVTDIHPQEDLPHVMEQFEKQLRGEIQVTADLPLRRKDGSVLYADINSASVNFGGKTYLMGIFRDITGRKQAEEKLRDSENRFRNLVETTGDWIWEINENTVYTYSSPQIQGILGYAPAEIIGKTPFDLMTHEEARRLAGRFGALVEAQQPLVNLENTNLHKDGHPVILETSGVPVINAEGKFCGYRGIDRDITERKKAAESMMQQSALLRRIMDSIPDLVLFKDVNSVYLGCNKAFEKFTGRPESEQIGKTDFDFFDRDTAQFFRDMDRQMMESKQARSNEEWVTYPDGHKVLLDTLKTPFYSPDNEVLGLVGISRDITERKQAENALLHANRALATLGAVNRTLVHATDEQELLQDICQSIVEQRSYRMAWVGFAQDDAEKTIRIMARAGHEEGYLDTMQLSWTESERGMGPSGRAIRSGATQLCQDIANDPQYAPWRDAALQRGYLSGIALPLKSVGNKVFGILNVYAAEANAFSSAEIELLEEMAGDLAFGVNTLHVRGERDAVMEKNRQQLIRQQDSLEETIGAIAGIVDMRDPYTSGHQARVAGLAEAIARQMGLPDDQVHGIRLAGLVHDLGKIRVPSEILSKPGRLDAVEFELIKMHAQAGYDILKGINFPWPISQMVRQHHERLDGSGYPQGLKGDEILPGSRILAVADVVEAMYSHRPYRPGLGIEAALGEITAKREVYFDPAAVDACLVLFREQGYSFAD